MATVSWAAKGSSGSQDRILRRAPGLSDPSRRRCMWQAGCLNPTLSPIRRALTAPDFCSLQGEGGLEGLGQAQGLSAAR